MNNKTKIGKSFNEGTHSHFFEKEIMSVKNYTISKCLVKINHLINSNTTVSNYTMNNSSTTEVEIDLNYPDEFYLNDTINYLILQNDEVIHQLCKDCINKIELWKELEIQINKISKDMELLINIFDTKSEIKSLVSFKINQLNYAISKIQNSRIFMKISKAVKCSNETEIEEVYNNIRKVSGELVDSIQKSIRKKNINLNFILIQEKN